jgi:hypothetical protein
MSRPEHCDSVLVGSSNQDSVLVGSSNQDSVLDGSSNPRTLSWLDKPTKTLS